MIINYKFRDNDDAGWSIGPCQLGRVNLFVGETGSGKTRALNTIFNIADFVRGDSNVFRDGQWDITLLLHGDEYHWEYQGVVENNEPTIVKDFITIKRSAHPEKTETTIDRNRERFLYNGSKLPKLPKEKSSITLLKEEDTIKDIYFFFSHIYRRSFQNEDLMRMGMLGAMANIQYDDFKGEAGKEKINMANFSINLRMHILFNSQKPIYDIATNVYKSVFPKISSFSFDLQKIVGGPIEGQVLPIFRVHETGVTSPVSYSEMSSGMQKVLGIITDILLLPKGSLYLIDEYENSLGVNAIDFLPEFLEDHGEGSQFMITTHHPYLINNMPLKTWRVFRRSGSKVAIVSGSELHEKYGKSKQSLFTQLINDPIYTEG